MNNTIEKQMENQINEDEFYVVLSEFLTDDITSESNTFDRSKLKIKRVGVMNLIKKHILELQKVELFDEIPRYESAISILKSMQNDEEFNEYFNEIFTVYRS